MAAFAFPCLAILVAYSLALTTPNISTTSAHVIDQELTTTDLPLIPQPPRQAPPAQGNAVAQKGQQPTATELLSTPDNSPCAQGLGRQMQYWPIGPPGPVGVPGRNFVLFNTHEHALYNDANTTL